MSKNTESGFKPTVYVKGDASRSVETPADAVAAKFDGFRPQTESDSKPEVDENTESRTATPDPEAVQTPAPATPDTDSGVGSANFQF